MLVSNVLSDKQKKENKSQFVEKFDISYLVPFKVREKLPLFSFICDSASSVVIITKFTTVEFSSMYC